MDSKTDYKLPLEELLNILETSGYELSIEQVLEIQSVLLSTSLTKTSLKDLKYILTPILAKNDEDQKDIYRIIDAYIKKKTGQEEEKEKKLSFWGKLTADRERLFWLKLAGCVLIILTGALFYFLNSIKSDKLPVSPPPPDKVSVLKGPPRREPPNPGGLRPRNPRSRPQGPDHRPPIDRIHYLPEFNGPIIPQSNSYNLQMSLAFGIPLGIILSFFIFYERRRKMEEEKRKRIVDSSTNSEQRTDRTSLTEQNVESGPDQFVLDFQQRNYLITRTREFSKIKSNLKKLTIEEDEQVDIQKSIRQTARNAGFTALVRNTEWKERKYLFISNHKEPDAHMTHLQHYLISFLRGNKVPIVRYSYANDVMLLKDSSGNNKHLDQLIDEYADYHLILLSDCHSFFNHSNLQLKKSITTAFQPWASKSIITPIPLPDWSYLEVQLQNEFNIVPAEIEAIELLSKAIIEKSSIKRSQLENKIRDLYSVTNFDFQSAVEIRHYLQDEKLFQAVCSLAIYPKLRWPMTLALLSAVLNNSSKASIVTNLDYDTLLKVSRIPWLYTGKMDDSLRFELLNYLDTNVEIIARETILQLLGEVKPFTQPDSLAFKEFEVQYTLNSFFLYAHDQQKYRQYALAKNDMGHYWSNLTEWALKERTDKGESGLMPVQQTGQRVTVEDFILKEREFEKKNITLTKVALVTLPTVLLYILFSIFRPNIVYPYGDFKKVAMKVVINTNDSCEHQPTRADFFFVNGRSKSFELKGVNHTDTILLEEMRYNEPMEITLGDGRSIPFKEPFLVLDSMITLYPDCYTGDFIKEPVTSPENQPQILPPLQRHPERYQLTRPK